MLQEEPFHVPPADEHPDCMLDVSIDEEVTGMTHQLSELFHVPPAAAQLDSELEPEEPEDPEEPEYEPPELGLQ